MLRDKCGTGNRVGDSGKYEDSKEVVEVQRG